jgi:hypothetical protein
MRKRSAYWRGLEILGADPVYYGPPSPADLAKLDRKLTPAEQAAVDAYQSSQADQQLADVRKQGGPQSKTVSVTEKGATIQSLAQPKAVAQAEPGMPWWQLLLIIGGIGLTGTGVYLVARN